MQEAVRATPRHFDGQPVIQSAANRPAEDGHASQFAVNRYPDRDLGTDNGAGMPMMLGDELVRLLQCDWNGLHAR